MAKSKPTPISEQAVCTQPTVYTFNFKEVPISKYAETLDILFHNPDYNELVEKRNKLVKSADRLRSGTSEMANIVRTIQQRDRRLADIMYASIVQANIRSEVSNDFLSFDTLLKYYVDYRKDGMRECVSRMAANLDKVTFLADMLESVVTEVKSDMRQAFDDIVEFHQFDAVLHVLTQLRGFFKTARSKDDDSPEAQARLLELAALAESASSHPIGKSLLQAYGKAVDRQRITSLREWSGKGVVAEIANVGQVAVGGEKMMLEMGLHPLRPELAGTVVHLAIREQYAGCFVLGDRLKPTATAAIGRLRQAGISQIVMLTGDTERAAQQMAERLGLDRVCSELLPADKVAQLEEILHHAPIGTKVAFVGDGINDAPALTRADIGIAMGAIGSDAAIEAADVVIMDDDPRKISTAIRLSRKCLNIVRANIAFALGIKAACLLLGVFGIVNMWLAIFADVGVMVLAVLNALRAIYVRGLDKGGLIK